MPEREINIEATANGVILPVRVVPRSSQNRVAGTMEGDLRLRVTAAPVEGAANAAVVSLVAKSLGVAKGQVRITSGETSRRKRVEVEGVSLEEARRALAALRQG